MELTRSTILPASAKTVWDLLQQPSTLETVAKGYTEFGDNNFPLDQWQKDEVYHTWPIVFGHDNDEQYTIVFTHIDPVDMVMITEEKSEKIAAWNHVMHVEPIDEKTCRYIDNIEIHAGWRTFFVWFFAWFYYRHRHKNWVKLLKNQAS